MKLSNMLLKSIISLAIGSVFGIYININLFIYLIFSSVLITLLIIFLRKKLLISSQVIFCLCILIIGCIWGSYNNMLDVKSKSFDNFKDAYTTLQGEIINNPESKNGYQEFIFKINNTRIQAKSQNDQILLFGDKIKAYGKLRIAEDFESENGKLVRYESMIRSKNIDYLFDIKRVEIISRNNGNIFIAYIYNLKERFRNIINSMESPESGLLFSMVFGGKNSLPEDIINYFKIAGLLHIVVLSGQNLTIISYVVIRLFSNTIGFRAGHLLAIIFIIIYAIMGGLEPATLRATFMSLILIASYLFGKNPNAGRVLALSASVMIIMNPYILFDNPSFQLSVLAFSGVIFLSPIIERWLIIRNVKLWLSSYLSAILGAQISVLPYLIYSSGTITPYALIANFFSLFVVGVVTVFGMISVFVGLVSSYIFSLLSIPLSFVLDYIIKVAKFVSSLPFSTIDFHIQYTYIVLIYIIIIYYIYKEWRKDIMTPLSLFILKNEKKDISNGRIPWIDEVECETGYDKNINENAVIEWK